MREEQRELVKLLASDCEDLNDVQALLKDLFKETIEEMLESEMDEHLGYDKNSTSGNNSGNSRKGYNKKTIQSQFGESELKVPRDRNGDFAPRVLGKDLKPLMADLSLFIKLFLLMKPSISLKFSRKSGTKNFKVLAR